MKNVMGGWFEWLHEWIEVERYVDESKLTEIRRDGMRLNKLTQAVFDGLPSEYRWAAVVDWLAAPEGATHWHEDQFIRWTGKRNPVFGSWDMDAWLGGEWLPAHWGWQGTLETFLADGAIPRPESIHDVARSIEAARVAEQSERTYPHYFKDVSAVDAIDLYHVARLYDITDPALFHAFKKIACAGKRGAKDQAQDVQEAIDALKRWQELNV